MTVINVTALKTHLRKYLRMASRGSRIVVKDGEEPIALLCPVGPEVQSWREQLSQAGRLVLGTQDWSALQISKLDRPGDIQKSLRAVYQDARDGRRR